MTPFVPILLLTHPFIPLIFVILVLFIYIIVLHRKIHMFTRGTHGASLESTIKKCVESVTEIEKRNEVISKHVLGIETRLKDCIRNVSVARFKAFDAGASNQSFSISLLNEKGDGVVISSLHHRDRVTTFAKPIEKYSSSYELTEEELSIIEEAKTAHKKSTLL